MLHCLWKCQKCSIHCSLYSWRSSCSTSVKMTERFTASEPQWELVWVLRVSFHNPPRGSSNGALCLKANSRILPSYISSTCVIPGPRRPSILRKQTCWSALITVISPQAAGLQRAELVIKMSVSVSLSPRDAWQPLQTHKTAVFKEQMRLCQSWRVFTNTALHQV